VSPSTIEEFSEVETGRGLLMKEKPGGVASELSSSGTTRYPGFSKGKKDPYCKYQPSQRNQYNE
jgi:hypothetical protein